MPFIFKRYLLFLIGSSFLGAIGTQFLTVPTNAKELALGAHATAPDLNTVNPALLNTVSPAPEIHFNYGRWLGDSRMSALYVAWPTRFGYGGLRARYLKTSDLELRTTTPTDVALAHFGAFGFTLEGLSSWKVGRLTIGVALRLISMEIYTESSSGAALDLGAKQVFNKHLTVGISLLNLGTMSPLENQVPKLPLRFLLGSSYRRENSTFSHTVLVTGEWSSQVPGGILLIGGTTRWQQITFRLSTRLSQRVVAIGSGFGFSWGIYQLNYGLQFGSQGLGLPQSLDISVRLP